VYFSLTFGDSKNTWTDWGLIPDGPPMVPPPTPNQNLVDVPGRVQGPIDLSVAIFGRITYQRISGTWNFLKDVYSAESRLETYETIRNWLHGRTTWVVLEEDPEHYFYGRFTVSVPQTGSGPLRISIGYDLEPVRYNLDDSIDETWVQNWEE